MPTRRAFCQYSASLRASSARPYMNTDSSTMATPSRKMGLGHCAWWAQGAGGEGWGAAGQQAGRHGSSRVLGTQVQGSCRTKARTGTALSLRRCRLAANTLAADQRPTCLAEERDGDQDGEDDRDGQRKVFEDVVAVFDHHARHKAAKHLRRQNKGRAGVHEGEGWVGVEGA